MNQPSGNIIQVGACWGDPLAGEIREMRRHYVRLPPEETVSAEITKLTGITQDQLDSAGMPLAVAYESVAELVRREDTIRNLFTWGGNDASLLVRQAGIRQPAFGQTVFDVKKLYQVYRMATGQKMQSGLAKSMTKLGMVFEGRKHDGLDDAVNTFRVFHRLLIMMSQLKVDLTQRAP